MESGCADPVKGEAKTGFSGGGGGSGDSGETGGSE